MAKKDKVFMDMSRKELRANPLYQGLPPELQAQIMKTRNWRARTGPFAFVSALWEMIWHMGMYSSDPHIAQMAIVHTVQEGARAQQAQHARERAEDVAYRDGRPVPTGSTKLTPERIDELAADYVRRHPEEFPNAGRAATPPNPNPAPVDDEERMRQMARIMAEEFFAAAEKRRPS